MKGFLIFNPILKVCLSLGLCIWFDNYVFQWVCLSVFGEGSVTNVVCVSVVLMFGMGFVCLCVCRPYVWHGVCLFVCLLSLCLAWGLSVCVSVVLMFGMGFVGLCVCRPYVWHGVCRFVCLFYICL